MKNKLLMCVVAMAVMGLFGSCGSSGGTGTGTATVDTLSSVPSMDLSSYDYSAQAASADIAAPFAGKSAGVLKVEGDLEGRRLGDSYGAIGSPSRAGCEANMHKKEAVRMSQEAQLDRCYMEAMEKGGLITIPAGSYNSYKIMMAEPSEEDKEKMCMDMPDQEGRDACIAGNEGPKGGNMLVRIGRFGDNNNELRIDMCQGAEGQEAKVNEATYTAVNNTYTGTVIRKGNWGGHEESMKFAIGVTADAVVDGIADLGTAGSATAEGWMNGGFGHGHLLFTADASDLSTTIQGAFSASFQDAFRGVDNSFTGKTHAKFGGVSNTGTAKFSFSGTHPAMPLAEMVAASNTMEGARQEGIPADQLASFYQFMSEQLGVAVNAGNLGTIKVCPSENGMELAVGDTCEESKTGLESFSIGNVARTGDDYTSIEQTFLIILHEASAFYNDVKDVDLGVYDAEFGTIDFTRTDWNCTAPASGWTLEIRPDDVMRGERPVNITVNEEALRSAIQACNTLEEKLRENMGMGGHDCSDRQMRGDAGEKFGGGTEAGHSGDEGGMIPAPCSEQRMTPEECKTYCDVHSAECYTGGGGEGGLPPAPPSGEQMPQYCSTQGWTIQQCGEYCQSHPADCGMR